jgi:two-component system response regulator QseB
VADQTRSPRARTHLNQWLPLARCSYAFGMSDGQQPGCRLWCFIQRCRRVEHVVQTARPCVLHGAQVPPPLQPAPAIPYPLATSPLHDLPLTMRVLLVEDDSMIGAAVAEGLRGDGHAVDWVQDGLAGARALEAGMPYSLLLLDLGLPGRDGLKLLADLRARGDRLPVLVLTARDTVRDRIAGLDAGADDYLVKPFDLDELLARVRALQRRAAGRAEPQLSSGRLRLDPATHAAWLDDEPLQLSAREFALLQALMERPDAVLSRAQLEERLYGWNEPVGSNAIEVHIHHLRRKLGDGVIRNLRGVGWTLGEPAPRA